MLFLLPPQLLEPGELVIHPFAFIAVLVCVRPATEKKSLSNSGKMNGKIFELFVRYDKTNLFFPLPLSQDTVVSFVHWQAFNQNKTRPLPPTLYWYNATLMWWGGLSPPLPQNNYNFIVECVAVLIMQSCRFNRILLCIFLAAHEVVNSIINVIMFSIASGIFSSA